jgi:hypothetical protein
MAVRTSAAAVPRPRMRRTVLRNGRSGTLPQWSTSRERCRSSRGTASTSDSVGVRESPAEATLLQGRFVSPNVQRGSSRVASDMARLPFLASRLPLIGRRLHNGSVLTRQEPYRDRCESNPNPVSVHDRRTVYPLAGSPSRGRLCTQVACVSRFGMAGSSRKRASTRPATAVPGSPRCRAAVTVSSRRRSTHRCSPDCGETSQMPCGSANRT